MRILKANSKTLEQLYNRQLTAQKKTVVEKVHRILSDIRQHGDDAVVKYTKRFDGATLDAKEMRVPECEISAAFQNITSDFVTDLKKIIHNVTDFYKAQKLKPARINHDEGILLREQILPLDSVGIYVPAGTAPLVSTVYMSVIPAKVAGVKRIVLATPPNKDGYINPYVLAVANLLKVDEIYKIGGAQAIAALAFGTKNIAKVDKIVGPGNMYVTEAKRQVFGHVDIDMLAGPSELVVIANRHSNPDFVVAEMEGQAEHLGGLSILITNSRQLLKQVKGKIQNGYGIFAKNTEEIIAITNKLAPEHLQILTNNPNKILKGIRHAGAIFLGAYSPTALGDYGAGPSHILPTMGSAKFFSGLCLSDFVKKNHIICYSKKALEKIRGPIERVAQLEGLQKHYESIRVRFN
ncbi:MAG: histidinol dehydrogenase [Candidatus Omnitrophota bacterium]